MGDGMDHLAERVKALEERMDQVPALLDRRFDAVDAAIAEQRQFTEFVFGELLTRLGSVETRLDHVEAGQRELEAGLRTVTAGMGRLERKLDQFIDR